MSHDPFELPKSDDAEADSWLVTYADAITLLMAFFVVMFSISEPSQTKLEQVTGGMIKELHGTDVPTSPFINLAKEVQVELKAEDESKSTDVSATARGMTFDFKSAKMFSPGSADILEDAEASLDRIAQLITFMGIQTYKVEVEGHTDDVPIETPQFPSNWELSTARAAAVVRFLISRGVKPERLAAIGYADTQPKVPHRDKDGNPILANREENRRVVVRIQR
jgi:chemotaxis protein MotB